MPVREKKIVSGPIVEVAIYPITEREKHQKRAKKVKATKKEQKLYNDKVSLLNLNRILNANFDNTGLFGHFTYSDKNRPETEKQAMKDVQNYLRRVRHWISKNTPGKELKYVAVVETSEKGKLHHHIIMSGITREVAEDLWTKGRSNVDRLQPNEFGFEEAATYISKDRKNSKRRMQSKNLIIPEPKVRDSKFKSERAADKFYSSDDEKILKEYGCTRILSKRKFYNEINGKTYYCIKMRRLN